MTQAVFTRIMNSDGPLSKSFTLKDGRLQKTAAADLVRGRAIRIGANGIEDLAQTVCNFKAHEALTFGCTVWKNIGIVTQKALARGGVKNAVCRDRRSFHWPRERAVLMLDIDKPKDGSAPMKSRDFDALLCEILPWWQDVARFYRPSVSAFLYDMQGNQITGPGSLRCYAIVDKGPNVPHVGLAITDALWKAGHGRIEFSAAGSMLIRCPIDGNVWQPERLDFAGSAILGPGLTQRRFPPLIIPGRDIDSDAAIAGGPGKITFAAWASNSLEVRKAKAAHRPEEKARRESYVTTRVEADVAQGAQRDEARRKWLAALATNVLPRDHVIYFRDKGQARVADILANLDSYDEERCADPHDPNYGGDGRIAVLYANRGHGYPAIFSHAHGGYACLLTRQRFAA